MRWRDIPLYPKANYQLTIQWSDLEQHIASAQKSFGLDLSPPYQRAHVWNEAQQRAFVEYHLKGGEVSRALTFNCPFWMRGRPDGSDEGPYEIVDGKQRLEAVRKFLRGELKVFGRSFSEFEGHLRGVIAYFDWRVCDLQTRPEVLELYLNINAGGTPHSQAELDKVRDMLKDEADLGA